MEQKCTEDQEDPDERTRVGLPGKLHWGWDGPSKWSPFFQDKLLVNMERNPQNNKADQQSISFRLSH